MLLNDVPNRELESDELRAFDVQTRRDVISLLAAVAAALLIATLIILFALTTQAPETMK